MNSIRSFINPYYKLHVHGLFAVIDGLKNVYLLQDLDESG